MQYSKNNLTRKNNLKDFSYHIDLHGYAHAQVTAKGLV